MDQQGTSLPTPPEAGGRVYDLPISPHDHALATLRAIRLMLDELPLEWQIAVVKALTARTLVKAYEQAQLAQAVTA